MEKYESIDTEYLYLGWDDIKTWLIVLFGMIDIQYGNRFLMKTRL